MTQGLEIILTTLIEEINEGKDVEANKNTLALMLIRAVDIREITHEYACKIDEQLNLNIFC